MIEIGLEVRLALAQFLFHAALRGVVLQGTEPAPRGTLVLRDGTADAAQVQRFAGEIDQAIFDVIGCAAADGLLHRLRHTLAIVIVDMRQPALVALLEILRPVERRNAQDVAGLFR